MSPCSALTSRPLSRSVRKSCSQRIFVRTKTIAWSGFSASMMRTSASSFSRRLHSSENCSTVSMVSVAALILTVIGSSR